MSDNVYIKYLLIQYLEGIASEREQRELFVALEADSNDDLSVILEELAREQEPDPAYNPQQWEGMLQQILPHKPATKIRFLSNWKKIAVAASILLFVTAGILLYTGVFNRPSSTDPVARVDIKAPVSNRAMVTLEDGRRIYLDSAGTGELIKQGDMSLMKLKDGELSYQKSAGIASNAIQYNILTNPRGSKAITLTLSDGTRVWLNCESSLRYPTAFTGNTREVEITGEAYFEVAHNAKQPFHVKKGEMDITVLGTHFNVNAYEDEMGVATTLLEGSVRVSRHPGASGGNPQSVLLKPGQQAIQNASGIDVNPNADISKVMAWKEGWFIFDSTGIAAVMKQIGRWYDVDIVYEGKITNETFGGSINKNLPLSDVLGLLKKNGINVTQEGKVIKVKR
jgi:ferric-dicitrate binding protein FerR (iron transport regulator)